MTVRCFCLMLMLTAAMHSDGIAIENPAPGRQVEQVFSDADGDMGYLLYLPEDYDKQSSNKWPLVLFLHGRGESNGPLQLVTKWGPPKFAARGDSLPFILVSPQCPRDGFWSDKVRQAQLTRLLDHVLPTLAVDEDRICLTGLSMGGYGSWSLAARLPQRFSCVVPICGSASPRAAEDLVHLPIWVFHGTDDKVVPYERSARMVKEIRDVGGEKVRFTSLEHVGHNSWSSTYALPQLYQWMLEQRASQNTADAD